MSQENVKIVWRIYDEWGRGNFREGTELYDPHILLVVRPDLPEFGVFLGADGISEYMHRLLEQWERLTIEADQLQAIGDTVLAHVVQHAKGRVSGIEGDSRFFTLFTFRGAKIVRIETLGDEDEALEAAGLRE
jgi:ketosteroid isomerase-like protein